jgi:ADP-ribose pyrophosphatase YjhB (NUDIX family)
MSLTPLEQNELVRLLGKLEFPTSLPVFFAWCATFGTVGAELAIMRDGSQGPEVFLTYREDKFFKGWHLPGCTHLPTETIMETFERTVKKEIGAKVSAPTSLGWFERPKGEGSDKCPRGYELLIVFTAQVKGSRAETETERFFPLSSLPQTIPNQDAVFARLQQTYEQAYKKARTRVRA